MASTFWAPVGNHIATNFGVVILSHLLLECRPAQLSNDWVIIHYCIVFIHVNYLCFDNCDIVIFKVRYCLYIALCESTVKPQPTNQRADKVADTTDYLTHVVKATASMRNHPQSFGLG